MARTNLNNIIDFIIALLSIVSLSLTNLKVLKALRLLRVMRPLRVIAKNEGLKVAIQALILAIPNIINVTIISLLFFLIFGIIAVNYFKGTYYYCETSSALEMDTKWDCINAGGTWMHTFWKFDDVMDAILTLF